MTTVGIVGTGRMGTAMARALRAAGLEVIVFNRTRARAEQCAADTGATVAPTASDVAARADITLTMLADDDAVAAVYRGPGGLLEGARAGTVLVDLSTVTPDTIRSLEADARAAGAGILDSPVSGSVTLAQSGQLTLMVGGTADDLERARPALEPLAKTIVHVGPLGAGAAMKLAVNTVIFGLNEALAEGLVLAEAAGVDRAMAYDVIAASAVGAPYVGYKRAAFVEPETTPVAFSIDLAAKDLGLIGDLAARTGVELPQSDTNLRILRSAAQALGGGSDFSAVASHLRNERKAVTPHAAGGT
jgi:3-hydroxyisobutyrate dehydrogenase